MKFHFNGDGDFGDPGEVVLSDAQYMAGVNAIPVAVPADAAGVMGVRVRLTDEAGHGGGTPTGPASSGEVEDYLLVTLSSYVWDDSNKDGIQNEDTGRNDVTVNLLDSDGQPMKDGNDDPIVTVTAVNPTTGEPGWYEFPGLPTGSYIVEFVAPVGLYFTLTGEGTTETDSNADMTTGRTALITLTPGENNSTIDAGLSDESLPVSLAYVYSERDDGTVSFIWATATEAGNAGFKLYMVVGSVQSLITTEMIPSSVIDSLEPVGYTYTANVAGEQFYIEMIGISGGTERHGPYALGQGYGSSSLSPGLPGVDALLKPVFLPLIIGR